MLIYLHWGKRIVFQEGESDDRHQQELYTECVILWVVCVSEAHVDQVHSGIGQSQEHHLRAESKNWLLAMIVHVNAVGEKDIKPGGC